jgi:tetratricopeptide (TPR) repeat protein
MTLGRIVGFLIVLAIAGFVLNKMGVLNFDKSGAPSVNTGDTSSTDIDPFKRAEALFMAGSYGQALGAYQGALQKEPNHPEAATALFRIGKSAEEMKKGKEALAAYKEFAEKFPQDNRRARAQERIEYLQSQYGK